MCFIARPCETITEKDGTTKTEVTFLQVFNLFPLTEASEYGKKNKKQVILYIYCEKLKLNIQAVPKGGLLLQRFCTTTSLLHIDRSI